MRLVRLGSAAAIVLLLVAAFPPTASASSATATIVSPSAGDTIRANATVRIHYAGYSSNATNLSVELLLDGASAGGGSRPIGGNPSNGTTFNVTLVSANFSSGSHALSARVWTALDAPVDTPAVSIVLDKPPVVSVVNSTYDLDARRLVVEASVTDDGGAPSIRLSSGPNSTNASFQGTQTIVLPAARGPGNYTAFLNATDGLDQTTRVSWQYVVLDREAFLSFTNVQYQLGGHLLLQGNVSDPDGRVSIRVETPLGSGDAVVSNNSTRWSASVPVTPQLGTFHGTIRSKDPWGGTTDRTFQFTIGGPNVTVYERTISTQVGAHAENSYVTIPAILGGRIEICVDGCSPGGPSTNNSTGPATGAAAILYRSLCQSAESIPCRQLTGHPGMPGQFDGCADAPSPVLIGRTVWTLVQSADDATDGRACRGLFDDVNATAAYADRVLGPGPLQGVAADDVAVRIGHTTFTPGGGASASAEPLCTTVGADARCAYASAQSERLTIDWAQGIDHVVTVRIVGVRV